MILVDPNISVKNISSFYNSLKKELSENDRVIIDFSNVRRVDLSVVQCIISAGRLARKQGKSVKIKGVSDIVRSQMQLCGLKT